MTDRERIERLEGMLERSNMRDTGPMDGHGGLDSFLWALRIQAKKREEELQEACLYPDALTELIMRDSARLIASAGGYAAPVDAITRDLWIRDKMLNDPSFYASANAVASLIHEYFTVARAGKP